MEPNIGAMFTKTTSDKYVTNIVKRSSVHFFRFHVTDLEPSLE